MNDKEKRKSRIDKLNETLYSRTRYHAPLGERSPVTESETPDVEEGWKTPGLDEMLTRERISPPINPFMKKVFVIALLFFVAAVLVAGFIFTGGANFVSSRNVDVTVLGPTVTSAGQVFELGVSVSNTNNADLEFTSLSIQYPPGSRDPDNATESLTYTKEDLGVIKAGSEATRNVRAVFLGAEGEVKEIKFSVEYKVKGSNATFFKDKIFEITIGEAPITLKVTSPSSVTSGNTFSTVVSVTLNSQDILKNVILKAEYPHGYSVIDATPSAVSEDNTWVLGDLSPGDKKTITIRGQLLGENLEERTFRFYVGAPDSRSASDDLKIVIVSGLNTVVIDRPGIGLAIAFNGQNTATYIAPAARTVATSIRFQNNLSEKILNPRLEARLSGVALDKPSVRVGNEGVYNPETGQVVWNLVDNLGNKELNPGESGQVSLDFASLASTLLSPGANDIALSFVMTGVPVSSSGPVSVSETRTVRISSQVNLSSRALRSLGPFTNTGSIPPQVDKETTYTVVLSMGNTLGDLAEAKITAQLGQGVSWLGGQDITGETISYNPLSNTVTWDMGTLSSDSGFSSGARELAFQVSLKPSLGQIGTAPVLVNGIVFSGRDTVTGNIVTANNPPLTTRLTADPVFIQGDDIVVK